MNIVGASVQSNLRIVVNKLIVIGYFGLCVLVAGRAPKCSGWRPAKRANFADFHTPRGAHGGGPHGLGA